MGKQERAAKAQATARRKASDIIQNLYAQALARNALHTLKGQVDTWRAEAPDGIDEATFALACEVRTLREMGTAWWAIGQELRLPGAGDSATAGKSGASYARKVYAAAFGSVPRVQRQRMPKKPQNPDVAALRETKKADRVAQVRAGVSVLREDMTDDEVVAAVDGRRIHWTINIRDLDTKSDHPIPVNDTGDPMFLEQNAIVCQGWAYVKDFGEKGGRCLIFKEAGEDIKWRKTPGSTRVVRLSKIHTIGKKRA